MRKKLYTVNEVAEKFNVTSMTIHNWIKQYEIDCHVTESRQWLMLTEDGVEQIKRIILKKYNLLEK